MRKRQKTTWRSTPKTFSSSTLAPAAAAERVAVTGNGDVTAVEELMLELLVSTWFNSNRHR